jgi:hypothetical protein
MEAGAMKPYLIDYAVYGRVYVPMILLDAMGLITVMADQEIGLCRVVTRRRRK